MMKSIIKGQTKMNLELVSYEGMLKRIEIVMGDLMLCIIDAALFLSSALICTTNMKPKILDIPALGFVGFVAAVGFGIYILIEIVKRKKK